jgi:hypothetical protein
MSTEDLFDRDRIDALCIDLLKVIKENFERGPISRDRCYEALNALGIAAAVVVRGAEDPEARDFFEKAFQGQFWSEPKMTTPQETEDAKVRADMQKLARLVDSQLPYGWGFVVLAFPFGAGARMNYISNAERADIVRAMYEFIEATKGRWTEHVPEQSAAAEDEQLARARQRIAELEGILREAKEVIESLSDHGSAAEAMRMIKAQQAEIERLKGQRNDENHRD